MAVQGAVPSKPACTGKKGLKRAVGACGCAALLALRVQRKRSPCPGPEGLAGRRSHPWMACMACECATSQASWLGKHVPGVGPETGEGWGTRLDKGVHPSTVVSVEGGVQAPVRLLGGPRGGPSCGRGWGGGRAGSEGEGRWAKPGRGEGMRRSARGRKQAAGQLAPGARACRVRPGAPAASPGRASAVQAPAAHARSGRCNAVQPQRTWSASQVTLRSDRP